MLADDKGFSFQGEQITKFEDLLPFVNFGMDQMPYFKVSEDQYDPVLGAEIRKVKERNLKSMGDQHVQYYKDGIPPLENLLLLTAIDEFIDTN